MQSGRRTTQLMAGGFAVLVLGLLFMAAVRADNPAQSLTLALILVGSGLAFISVPQSALFIQEAPPRYLGSVTAFRTTTGQFGFALGFATSGAMVTGLGSLGLHERMLKLGSTAVQRVDLEAKLREIGRAHV